ncbi:hypothetical protein CC80DRAFT_496578 [Byssothecium circinans]|uniref:Uncharacterized protein n=1 Tax=Byssothecium circinans TaxID=147558 RepID=A0A6A5T8B1_9PLEO|nr:hypothetical protein CC80DRAFT_497897 [Byssothecium circinans]KAF1950870.1 hypothetical protein CC80DRAFT_496578 [Byssothecium circinans]
MPNPAVVDWQRLVNPGRPYGTIKHGPYFDQTYPNQPASQSLSRESRTRWSVAALPPMSPHKTTSRTPESQTTHNKGG